MSVGVVIPVYNRARTVLATLDSVASQTLPAKRLVIVDDGSTDRSVDTVRQWIARHAGSLDVTVLEQSNRGPAAARNLGLQQIADCEYVIFLDSDDTWPADLLKHLVPSLTADPGVAAVSSDRRQIDTGTEVVYDNLEAIAENPVRWLIQHGAGVASCTLLRIAAVVAVGGFPEDLITGEDTEFFLQISQQGRWAHTSQVAVDFSRPPIPKPGEALAVSRRQIDNRRLWALVYDEFLDSRHGRVYRRDPAIRQLMRQRWLGAAHELIRNGRSRRDWNKCYWKSLRWAPWHLGLGWKCLRRSVADLLMLTGRNQDLAPTSNATAAAYRHASLGSAVVPAPPVSSSPA